MINDRCKPGDLAMVVGGSKGTNLGKTVLVLYDNEPPNAPRPKEFMNLGTFWRVRAVSSPLIVHDNQKTMEANSFDAWLMPLRPDASDFEQQIRDTLDELKHKLRKENA